MGVDIIRKSEDVLGITAGVLHRKFNSASFTLLLEIDNLIVDGTAVLVQVANEFGDTTIVVKDQLGICWCSIRTRYGGDLIFHDRHGDSVVNSTTPSIWVTGVDTTDENFLLVIDYRGVTKVYTFTKGSCPP